MTVEIETITRTIESFEIEENQLREKLKSHKDCCFYLVSDDHVQLAKVSEEMISDALLPHIQEVRVFNETMEIRCIRKGDKFIYRQCTDKKSEKGGNVHYIDEMHKLWGTVQSKGDGFSVLRERRGTSIKIPSEEYAMGSQIALCYRKYITFQDKDFVHDTPFSYSIDDTRLVRFCEFTGGAPK